MAFSALVALLIACAAAAAESAARLVGHSVRWIWGAAVALTLVVVVAAPYRRASTDATVAIPAWLVAQSSSAALPAQAREALIPRLLADVALPMRAVLGALQRSLPPSLGWVLLTAWILSSVVLGALFLAVYLRLRLARRSWPRTDMHGATVRVAPAAGPAVFGLIHPEIIVPRWLLARDPSEQRLVVTHEAEHVRAGDHLLLAAGGFAAVLLPWNPAIWWMLSRLRLAIELDCDARVLGTGVAPRSYGTLLIDLAEQSHGLRLGAPALIDGASHLQTRVMAMKPQTRRFARARGSLIGFAALSLLVVACEAKLPTASEIDQMDVASAERALVQSRAGQTSGYIVDGVGATAEQARALKPEEIVSVNVAQMDSTHQERSVIFIGTLAASLRATKEAAMVRAVSQAGTGGISTAPLVPYMRDQVRIRGAADSTKKPLVIIDGVRVDQTAIAKLDRNEIATIDVIKGQAAINQYPNDPAAANGVIIIVMKKPGAK
jgi:beta-lactamase regulating signal transducer with metallopeptidase domain